MLLEGSSWFAGGLFTGTAPACLTRSGLRPAGACALSLEGFWPQEFLAGEAWLVYWHSAASAPMLEGLWPQEALSGGNRLRVASRWRGAAGRMVAISTAAGAVAGLLAQWPWGHCRWKGFGCIHCGGGGGFVGAADGYDEPR